MGWLDILDVRRTIVASVSNTHSGLEIENIAKWLGQYPTQEGFLVYQTQYSAIFGGLRT